MCAGAALALYCTLHYEKPLAACIALSTFFPETRLPDPSLLHNKGTPVFRVVLHPLRFLNATGTKMMEFHTLVHLKVSHKRFKLIFRD